MVVMSMVQNEYKIEKKPKERQMSVTENILLRGIINLVKKWNMDITTSNEDDIPNLMENEICIFQEHISDLRELLEEVESYYKL